MTNQVVSNSVDKPDATQLALERTHLAHERTLMAWVRTATSLISFGFTIYKFFQFLREKGEAPIERRFGAREFALVMISVGLVALLLAALQHWQYMQKLRKRYHVKSYSLATFIALLISGLGILALVLVALRQ